MMVETILESSQDFGMSNGALPQWKRELLQRRAARSRPAAPPAPAPPPPPPPPAADEVDEELRYGPGIVKRLKSRYLSLALRDAPRRRPSVLRRATSLEHLLDERPPPAPRALPARAPRPASVALPPAPAPAPPRSLRRDSVKRARSVDALSRLDSREELAPPSPSPPPPLAPRPPAPRAARPPRRPAPLLRDAERPPPDVVRSTLRKFECAPQRRPPAAARLSAVARGLDSRRSVTPDLEPEPRTPSPPHAGDAPPPPTSPPPPLPHEPTTPPSTPTLASSLPTPSSLAIAPKYPTTAPCFPVATPSSPVAVPSSPVAVPSSPVAAPRSPIVAPSSPVAAPSFPVAAPSPPTTAPPALPVFPTIPAPTSPTTTEDNKATSEPSPSPRTASPLLSRDEPEGCVQSAARPVSRAALEGIARAGTTTRYAFEAPLAASHLPPLAATNPVLVGRVARRVGVIRPMPASPRPRPPSPPAADKDPERVVNGHSTPEPRVLSRIGAAGIERAWSGSHVKRIDPPPPAAPAPAPWSRGTGAATRSRAPPPVATSIVFNFSNRKEVPDYIENDGLILRTPRKNRIKAGEPGVVVLRPEALARSDSESETEECGPPSPCGVRFVNDNVLINGKSSMPPRPDRDRDRIAKLKLQFDDSLTRTFEYPSETSLCEESPPRPSPSPSPPPPPPLLPQDPPADAPATHLADNTHIASAALSRYRPHKTAAAAFQLGVTRRARAASPPPAPPSPSPSPAADDAQTTNGVESETEEAGEGEGESGGGGDARPCGADAARSWTEARTLATDLLF